MSSRTVRAGTGPRTIRRGARPRVTPLGTPEVREVSLGTAEVREVSLGTAEVGAASLGRTEVREAFLGAAEVCEAPLGTAHARTEDAGPCPDGLPHPRTPGAAALNTPRAPRTFLSRLNSRAVRTHVGTVVGAAILAALLWRLGTGVLLDGLRRIDTVTLLASLGIGVVTTVFSAWRWQLVARGLRLRLPFGPALADYYRALFLNAALPGGILGDVHRAVRHGQSAGDLRRGVKAVVLERVAGQIALTVFGAAVLLTLPSPVRADVRGFAPLVALAAVGALAVVVAVRMNRASARRRGALRTTLGEARQGLLSRQAGPGVALSSAVILAGHVAMFVVAARVAGSGASVPVLLPLAVLALVAMGLPLNVGGFGPREGVTAWAFGAAGLGASSGVAVAVVYGVLSFVASLPGAVVLVARWYGGLRGYPRTSPDASVDVSNANVAPKDSTRLASSSFPFSADPSEGRPMTPDSV
ncbi:lysylphosphatidylglycerol synthase transmembrane domain-containing protein [Streptomyces sp. NPDC007971]|uniref:lysylphosphatidylglycerol synthase transmembrane domain-containing protein n=1 Tax=Streptomyces sp. NPDC007971 TaxID=3364799 RepID=UPI0036E95DA1